MGGLVVGSIARQLGGDGRIFRVFSGGCSDKALLELDLGDWRHIVRPLPLDVLQSADPLSNNWAALETTEAQPDPDADEASRATYAARHEARVRKIEQRRVDLRDYLNGNFDALIVVGNEDDVELNNAVLELGIPLLRPGGRLVVLGQFIQPLAARQGTMREQGAWVNVRLIQLFTREYQ